MSSDDLVSIRAASEISTRVVGGPSGRAPFTAVVADGARLRPDFVSVVAGALATARDDTCLYTDFAVAGDPVAVGEWSVERARWQHWTGPVMVVPTGMLSQVADPLIDPPRLSHDVRHVPTVLVDVDTDDVRDLSEAERARFTATLPYTLTGTAGAPVRRLPRLPTRSIVIPTRGSTGRLAGRPVRWLDECLASLRPALADPAVDVVLVLDDDADPGVTDPWRRLLGDRLRTVAVPGPFNFSAKVNAGAARSRGDVVALLNDDVVAVTPDWLDRMSAVAMERDVGAVGAVLLFEDGTVQHRGHVFAGGEVHLLDRGVDRRDPGPRDRNLCDRDVSGVTAACLVQRREVWDRLGGLDPALPVAFNDVDYTERLRAAGYRVVLCNSVLLHHYESKTRSGTATPAEWRLIHDRWQASFTKPDPLTPLSTPPPVASGQSLARRIRERLTTRLRRS